MKILDLKAPLGEFMNLTIFLIIIVRVVGHKNNINYFKSISKREKKFLEKKFIFYSNTFSLPFLKSSYLCIRSDGVKKTSCWA